MKNNIFIRTGYSFFDSMLKVDDIINYAKKNHLSKIGFIDKNFMHATFDFYQKAKANSLNPIIGVEFTEEKLILIAKNNIGYYELIKLNSHYHTNKSEFEKMLKLVLSNGNVLSYKNEDFVFSTYEYIKDKDTFALFKRIDNDEAIINKFEISLEDEITNKQQILILDEINKLEIDINIEQQSFDSAFDFFDSKEDEILEQKVKQILTQMKLDTEEYKKRLDYELSVIRQMHFSAYFLIVEDYVNFAKQQNIFVGPGRGSAPGSLVSFLLGITSIDPVKNNLLFERFLNPSRITVPDIDIDFQDDRRQEVIDYLIEKYNAENIAQIITFQTFQTKNTIKDISRLFGIDFKTVNSFTKLFSDKKTFEQNLRTKEVKGFIEKNNQFNSIIEHSKKIINLPRQISTHAAGILISKNPISDKVPTMLNLTNNQTLSQFSMDFLEINGVIKFDLLGLKNLSTLKAIFDIVKITRQKDLKLELNNFENKEIFKLLSEAKTQGIFQLESLGMKQSLEKIKVDRFEDIVAIISLFRPGPMKNIDEFAKRKNTIKNNKYLENELLNEILKETYGIIVYQEQILEIASKVAGFSLSKADNLRRAISKKDSNKIVALKDDFINGSIANGFISDEANKIYDLIYEFTNYGFNRSHAFAYAVISYNFAFLKKEYPLEFSASYLSSIESEPKKIQSYIDENNDVNILLPSLLKSFSKFSLEKSGIRIGFSTIKGIGIEAVNKILKSKEEVLESKNKSIYYALLTLSKNGITSKIIESLIKVGTFDDYDYTRESLLESYKEILDLTKLVVNKNNEIDLTILSEDDLPKISKIDDKNNLEYEKDLLGFSWK